MKNLQTIFKSTGKFLSKNSAVILTGLGVAGLVMTTILAIKAAPKARDILDEECYRRGSEASDKAIEDSLDDDGNVNEEKYKKHFEEYNKELTKFDMIKLTWKCYLPVFISGAASIACIIGSHSIHAKRHAALAGLYSLSETAIKEYKDKILSLENGKDVLKEANEKIAKKNVDKKSKKPKKSSPDTKKDIQEKDIISTGTGEDLCMVDGRVFRSSKEHIRSCVNDLNEELLNSGTVISLNDFYRTIGLRGTPMGDYLGWNTFRPLKISFSTAETENGRPCLVIDYTNLPTYDFEEL